jgi:predicted  nucleic acid-binding Zn-ribbon protein
MILYEGPAHGYSVLSSFKQRLGREISPSLVYPFLQQLEAKGLFKRFANLVSVAIEPSLNVCAHCGCKVYEGGYREVIEGKETMFCCSHCAGSYKEERKLAKAEGEKHG